MRDHAAVPTSHLALSWATRVRWAESGSRPYLDFVVDGQSLLASLGGGDYVTPFGWLPPWAEDEAARRLLLADPTPLEGRRQEIYVCSECADLGCGALTAIVERDGNRVVWRDFGYQRGPKAAAVDRAGYDAVGPLAFEHAAYGRAIRSALGRARDEHM